MSARNDRRAVRLQYGALPYRQSAGQGLEILLVTTRTTRRWIIPKGWPMKRLKPGACAAREAFEEAGVTGRIAARALGSFEYEKLLDDDSGTVPCEVEVIPLRVERQLEDWPEKGERETRWVDPVEAMRLVTHEGLRTLIARFAQRQRAKARKA